MKVETIRIINGANVYSHRPVAVMRLDLEDLRGRKSREIEDFNRRLVEALPELKKHFCDRGHEGGFIERLEEGTGLHHVIEHVALELLAQTGFADQDRRTGCRGDEKDDSKAVVETTTVETTRYLMPIAAELTDAILREKTFFAEEKIVAAKDIAADSELGPSTAAIVRAAEKRGIPWTRENDYSLIQLGYGKNLHYVQAAVTDRTSALGADLAGDKDETKKRLDKFSIPVPEGEIVRTEEEAVAALEAVGAPVVVKPLDGRQGKGVSLNLSSPEEVAAAFRHAREYSRKVLVEELFGGKNYRVLVVDGVMVAASERLPCYVTGDGKHTIAELIEIENRNPLRGEGHEKPLTKIKITPILTAAMEKEGLKLEDVPAAGKRAMLCGGMNLSTGGTARDVTDAVHPTVKSACERAARVVNLDVCGVDLVLEDIAAPLPKEKGGVIEINAAPGLRMHTDPSEGKPRDVGAAIVEMLYPAGAPARIPIISVTGTNGKTTVTRMISHVLAISGASVGTTTTDGIFLNGQEIVRGDTTGPVSAKTILGDRAVQVAVLETARGGIVRRGLGYDWSDISVLTNISEDHIGQDDIHSIDDLINIKALLAERVRAGGTLIVNADDPNSLRVLERAKVKTPARRIVFFSLDENNAILREHLAAGGLAYFPQNGQITEAHGKISQPLLKSADIPVTMNGAAEFQVANVLAAVAACRAYGLAATALASLKSFDNAAHNPGRNNLYRVGSGYALIDYGHNPGAFEAICKMAANWKGFSVTGIIGVPGDRDDELIVSAARVAARGFQRIVIKEDTDLRGRRKGEVARLLCETVNREAPDRSCTIVLDEVRAFAETLAEMRENEIVVVFYDKLAPVLEVLAQNGAVPAAAIEAGAAQRPNSAQV
ncbi:MAG TPA: cyanophycin synthetase [Pyrinomonadaceae bacterium]|jgi:cyanophycin synthetase